MRLQFRKSISETPYVVSYFSHLRGAFADLETHEPADGNFIAKLLGGLRHVFFRAHLGIPFHKTLIHEAIGLVKFFQNALKDFLHRLRRLALETVGLRGNFPFLRNNLGGHLFA